MGAKIASLRAQSSQGNGVGPTCYSQMDKVKSIPPPLDPFPIILNPHQPYSPRVFRWRVRTEARLRPASPPTTLFFLALTPKFSTSPATATRATW
ncbi:hypothetical protein E2542_SST14487 [Spatholobus suberectus]|nr:hypothetical protein E2542_SST14487 [Spatholobus suberectus]